jgi:hypothetical protein
MCQRRIANAHIAEDHQCHLSGTTRMSNLTSKVGLRGALPEATAMDYAYVKISTFYSSPSNLCG